MPVDAEIKANAEAFRSSVEPKLSANIATISTFGSSKLDDAYARLTTLQAWRVFVFDKNLSDEALGFFSEAQNDSLASSVLISLGMWRPAMKSLRSFIENTLHCLYFNDHPIEYRLWDKGKFRPTFKELFDYFLSHPDIADLPDNIKGIGELKMHYKHLSNVVHASAREFRMTSEMENLKLWNTSAEGIGKWATTHKNVLRDTNLLLLCLLGSHLRGASHKAVRESLSIVIPASRDSTIKSNLNVKILR